MIIKTIIKTIGILLIGGSQAFSSPIVIVDKDQYMFHVMDERGIVQSQRAIIGRDSRPTPTMEDQITHIVINPKWHVPSKLARLDVVPKIKKDPQTVIARYGYRFFTDHTKQHEIDPLTIDWDSLTRRTRIPFYIVQDPGPRNSLGQIKFILTNKKAVFIHGTPGVSLFEREVRTFSSGCIRIENPISFASYLLPEKDIPNILSHYKNEQWIKLPKPISVLVLSKYDLFNIDDK